jgi:protein-disulfide isomerase
MLPTFVSLAVVASAVALAAGCKASEGSQSAATASTGAATQTAANISATASPAAARPAGMPTDSISERADRGRIQGDPNAPLWIIEMSDFQCPFCKTWHDSTYPGVVRDYVKTGKVRLAYLNFPLRMHAHAMPAAEAAMCSSAQGKFWEMHDAVFSSQDRWVPTTNAQPIFESLAGALGIDMAAWRTCMSKHLTRALIQADLERSSGAGIESTPSFFVGDQGIAGAQPYAVFRDAIEQQLKKKGASTSPAR